MSERDCFAFLSELFDVSFGRFEGRGKKTT